jgi:processive 1,2-diacylglycerol beta-glucosyltransferase
MTSHDDNGPLVTVFETVNSALLPLAATTLDAASIDYGFRPSAGQFPVVFGHPAAFVDADGAVAIVVRSADADRARDLLADLQQVERGAPLRAAAPIAPSTGPARSGPPTIRLTEAGSGALIGRITDSQLRSLVDVLEEESADDRDYYIDPATIDLLASTGADADLVELLRRALGTREGVEIAWARD